MPAAGLLKYWYLACFSRPREERKLYRAMRRTPVVSIVELGVGATRRTKRLIEVAQRYRPGAAWHYTGVDLFESRQAGQTGLTLKEAHKALGTCGAKIRLLPGDPYSALSRSANTLTNTDLLIISADQDRDALAKAWFYVPRMLHERSLVFVEEPAGPAQPTFRRLSLNDVAVLAALANVRPAKRAA